MSKWNLIINVGRCENCYNCVIADRDEHVGNDFPGYAAPAAAVGDSPVRILRRVQGSAPMLETTYLPVMCNHCDDAPCIRHAGDAIRKRDDGIVIIDPAKSQGRKDIVDSCPYGAIVWNHEQQVPQTWIFDAHLLDQGWQRPRCQQVCPTEVFEAVKLDDTAMAKKSAAEGLQVLKPELGARPRVWYRGLERWETCFIGGSVSAEVDGVVDCVEGAEVTLSRGAEPVAKTMTDAFGDFRFEGLPGNGGAYRVEVTHARGSARRDCELSESVYLAELRLSHASWEINNLAVGSPTSPGKRNMKRKFDPKVFQLGYVALDTADLERTKDHYLETLGMTETAKGDDGEVYLSIGRNHHDIVLRQAEQKALVHVGYHLKPHISVTDFAREVQEFGLKQLSRPTASLVLPNWLRSRAPAAMFSSSIRRSRRPRPGSRKPARRSCASATWR